MVSASSVGLSTNPGQFAFGAIGVFIIPLSKEFGWQRAEISFALTIFTMMLAISLPYVGRLVDRKGGKEVLIPSLFVFGGLLALIPLLVSELWHLYAVFLLIGSLAAGANALPYLRIIGAWFDRRRGLAFGLAMAGGGLGYAYVPPMLQYLIDQFGWRSGYYALSAIVLIFATPLVSMVLRNSPAEMGLSVDGDVMPDKKSSDRASNQEEEQRRTALNELLRSNIFWLLFLVFALLSLCLYGLMSHLVPMLIDRGVANSEAAFVASVLGMSIVVSRAVIGYLIDKFFAPRVAIVCILLSTIGIMLLASGTVGSTAYLAAILVGLSIGAEIDLLAFLATRYFGLGSFGLTYGLLFSAFLIGAASGPVIYGNAFDQYGSYVGILTICSVILGIIAGLLLLLPRYQRP